MRNIDYMMGGAFLTVALAMGSGVYNAYFKDAIVTLTPRTEQKILQIKAFSDNDEKPGLDTIILENGRAIQIEEKDNKLSILEK